MRILFSFIVLVSLGFAAPAENLFIVPSDARIQYFGRWDHSDSVFAQADWPGVYLRVVFQGTGCSMRMQGVNAFEVVVDGQSSQTVFADDSLRTIPLVSGLAQERHVVALYKRSESQTSSAKFYGLELDQGGQLQAPPALPVRRIEFIGDSYTAGYGMESPVLEPGSFNEDSLVLHTSNAMQAFGPLVARSLGADYQVNAVSGRGLVRNINGLLPEKPFGYYYDYTLMSARSLGKPSPPWNFASWHPQVIVIGLGINDFQGTSPPADSATFDQAYYALLDSLRARHPGVKFILCATAVWPNDQLLVHVPSIVASEHARGHDDVTLFEYRAEKSGLWWHPSVRDHQNIARELRPVVARVGGWMSR